MTFIDGKLFDEILEVVGNGVSACLIDKNKIINFVFNEG